MSCLPSSCLQHLPCIHRLGETSSLQPNPPFPFQEMLMAGGTEGGRRSMPTPFGTGRPTPLHVWETQVIYTNGIHRAMHRENVEGIYRRKHMAYQRRHTRTRHTCPTTCSHVNNVNLEKAEEICMRRQKENQPACLSSSLSLPTLPSKVPHVCLPSHAAFFFMKKCSVVGRRREEKGERERKREEMPKEPPLPCLTHPVPVFLLMPCPGVSASPSV